jgi:hypothetical protein
VGHSLNGSRRIAKAAAQGCMAQDLAILREHWKIPHSFALYMALNWILTVRRNVIQ